jgi:hypothetical protein
LIEDTFSLHRGSAGFSFAIEKALRRQPACGKGEDHAITCNPTCNSKTHGVCPTGNELSGVLVYGVLPMFFLSVTKCERVNIDNLLYNTRRRVDIDNLHYNTPEGIDIDNLHESTQFDFALFDLGWINCFKLIFNAASLTNNNVSFRLPLGHIATPSRRRP